MKTLLTANISTKTVNEGDSAWTPPEYIFGESLTLALRLRQNVNGSSVDPNLEVESLRAAIGFVDARPESGSFALQIGNDPATSANTTALLPHDCSPAALAAAINTKPAVVATHGSAAITKADGTWLLQFGNGAVEVPVKVIRNTLFPLSFGHVEAVTIDGAWIHAVRLIQAPVAFTDTSARVLPPPPSVTRLVEGGSEGGFSWNEVQALYVPPDFLGTYTLRFGDTARTGELSVSDNTETIQAALEAALGGAVVTVTNPRPYTANIEFIGDLKGTAQPLLEVLPLAPPPGDLTFTLALDTAALAVQLRRQESITLPLEVRLRTTEGDLASEQVAFRQDVTIRRPVILAELATAAETDWLRPPSPRDYIPFSPEQVITGQQHFTAVIGDGTALQYALAHGLHTEALSSVAVRENASGGRLLGCGTDYEVEITSDDEVVLYFAQPPTVASLAVCVTSAGPVSAFQNHTHTIGQITGLQALLDTIFAALAEITALLPSVTLSTSDGSAEGVRAIALPTRTAVFPSRKETPPAPGAKIKAGGLLPAIHDATVATFTALPLADATAHAGEVFRNDTGGAIDIPGGLGRKTASLASLGYFGSDGRGWYPLTHAGTTNSFFPADFERELWAIFVNDRMLRTGQILSLTAEVKLQMLAATSRMQCLLVIELGTMPSQASPDPTATNLQDVTWDIANPLLSQRLIVGDVLQAHPFGCAIARSASGITATRSLYGASDAAAATPTTANFALRARLIQWDTENSITGAKGLVSYQSTGSAQIA